MKKQERDNIYVYFLVIKNLDKSAHYKILFSERPCGGSTCNSYLVSFKFAIHIFYLCPFWTRRLNSSLYFDSEKFYFT